MYKGWWKDLIGALNVSNVLNVIVLFFCYFYFINIIISICFVVEEILFYKKKNLF